MVLFIGVVALFVMVASVVGLMLFEGAIQVEVQREQDAASHIVLKISRAAIGVLQVIFWTALVTLVGAFVTGLVLLVAALATLAH